EWTGRDQTGRRGRRRRGDGPRGGRADVVRSQGRRRVRAGGRGRRGRHRGRQGRAGRAAGLSERGEPAQPIWVGRWSSCWSCTVIDQKTSRTGRAPFTVISSSRSA